VTKDNKSVIEAKRAAEKSLFAAFSIDNTGFKGFAEDYNILKEGDGNAALLAVSAMLQGDRDESELTALLASLSVDLGDNGEWNDSLRRAQIADWAMKADIEGRLATIRANVEGWKLSDSKAPAFEGYVTNYWMKELGVGECTTAGTLFATKNVYSAYYAAKDSVYTDGDSSLVRLICGADGAWRFATDLEKDTAAFAPSVANATAMAGNINVDVVYVKEGVWRRGTELDKVMKFSCVADSVGKADSIIVNEETVWYICGKGNASVPYAWRAPTTAESDTAGFGVPGDGDKLVRLGNVNKSHYYVYEVDHWRFGTELDDNDNLGPCMVSKLTEVRQITGNANALDGWYICTNDTYSVTEGVRDTTIWRKATNLERDVYQWKSYPIPPFNGGTWVCKRSGLKYVFENDQWRPATELEKTYLNACTKLQNGVVGWSDSVSVDSWYKCTDEHPTVVDTFLVQYTWRKATDLEKDTKGWTKDTVEGAIRNGRVNAGLIYVFEKGSWRHGTDMDRLLGVACTESKAVSRDTSKASYKNEYYVCTEQQDSDTLRKWVVAPEIYNDTIGSQAECKAFGKYGDGTILVGRANLQKKYACENGVFREANGEDINANRACVGYIQNHIYKVNGVFRKCVDHEWIRPNGINLVGTLKTSDGQEYKTAVMADKLWMAQNLNSMTETSAGNCQRMVDANIGVDTVACDIHSACYDNKPENCSKYGRLYTRLAAQTACPAGWHLPSKVEWRDLLEAYATSSDGTRNRPYVLYATTDWEGISQERKDEYSFSILPSGGYNVWNGFKSMGWITYFWAIGTEMSVGMSKDWNFGTYNGSADMFSVRCIQD
jgi:uncharacterized protein (TIGR02145 family)